MEKFVSRKFIVALGVLIIEVLKGYGLNLPQDSEATINFVAIAYLGGQSFVDAVLAYKTKNNA